MRFDTGYGYESLAVNIVVQAVKDYRSALKKLQQDSEDFRAAATRAECEGFFRSSWFGVICSVDPEELLRKTEEVLERVNRD